ncbi:RagB/SusD family nutrient uptake outer membrane protein [Marinilabiliaceae bacterium JC017]|nr:RagB/SusD family nutrient uptake outer membrane protein [Marinilabiliaceae bacterium JC017]
MKNKFIILLIAVSSALNGCSEFLDEDLQGDYSSSTFFKTKEHAQLAINGAYQPASFTSVANALWVFGDVASDDATKGGNPGDQSEIQFIEEFNITPDNGYLEAIWRHYYEGVTRCNDVICYVPAIEMDEDLQKRIVGEGKFLRAYYYFHLVNLFGEIPLKTQPALTMDDLHVKTSPVEDIYAQIEKDLKDAALNLPPDYSGAEVGRVTSGAALGLLAKVSLFQEKWQKTLDYIAEIEKLNSYSLMSVYRNNFEVAYENNQESLFEIQHLTGQDPFLGSYLNQWFSPQHENGYFFNVPTQNLIDEFEVTPGGVVDPRLDYSVGREGQKWMNGEDFDPSWSPTGYLQKKHIQPLAEVGVGIKGDGDLNYTFMRYAEVLLMKAEALNELKQTSKALIPLNEVRQRARQSYLFDDTLEGSGVIPENLLPDVISTDVVTVRKAIRHERRVELSLEFHRFYDLMRYGKDVAEQALSGTNFSFDEHRYFPIPLSEKDSNKAL